MDDAIKAAIICALTNWAPPSYGDNPFGSSKQGEKNHGDFLFSTITVNTQGSTTPTPVTFMTAPAAAIATVFGPKFTGTGTGTVDAAGWLTAAQVTTLSGLDSSSTQIAQTMGNILTYFTTTLGIFSAPTAGNTNLTLYNGVSKRPTPQGPPASPEQPLDESTEYY